MLLIGMYVDGKVDGVASPQFLVLSLRHCDYAVVTL